MRTCVIVLFAFIAVQTLSAQATEFPADKKSAIVDNLTAGIVSGNTGIHTSASIVLSDLIVQSYLQGSDATKAMIPLLKLLENGKTDMERIAAAVALYQLGNEIGIYRLKDIAMFDDSKKVASVCKNLYYSYHKLHGTEYLISF